MAEEFHTGVCSGSWWNATRGGCDGPPPSAAGAASCSAAASDIGSFGWALEMMENKARSGEESAASVSGSSTLTFHGTPAVHASDPIATGGFLMQPTVPVAGSGLASPSMDWSQAFIRSNRRIEGGFHAMLHDHVSSRAYHYQEDHMESDQVHKGAIDNSGNPLKDFNQGFMAHRPHLNSGSGSDDGADTDFQGVSFACSSALLHDLLDQDIKPQSSALETCSTNFMPPGSYRSSSGESSRFAQLLKASPLKQRQSSSDHLQFSNDTTFWNASAADGNSMRAGVCSSTQTQFFTQQAFEEKPSHSIIPGKPNSEGARDSGSGTAKKSASEPALKKPRIETPSPLPTFKVRKEKLGDRITALQQLVSPFGKTDTASVLHEAIEYIKFLHEQVGVLSAPYFKNGPAMQHHQKSDKSKDGDGPKQDLRSRDLCLVPISATFPVVNEPTTADFWNPSFGGTYR